VGRRYRPDRGKVLGPDELARVQRFSRYLDADGDGVAARSLPGVHPKGAYFARGSGHDRHAAYTEDSAEYREVVDRLARKIAGAAAVAPAPVVRRAPAPTDVGIVSLGGCDAAVREAVDALAARGVHADYLRVRAFPFAPEVGEFVRSHARCFVVEQNRDAQLRALLAVEPGWRATT
jgi:2-oxoglutarate ferredoxin oxidoreductase subunit alpha